MSEPKLIQVQVVAQFAHQEGEELGEMLKPIVFTISPAEWKRGWDWQLAFKVALENLLNAETAPVD